MCRTTSEQDLPEVVVDRDQNTILGCGAPQQLCVAGIDGPFAGVGNIVASGAQPARQLRARAAIDQEPHGLSRP
jgi:hypothetical protein